MQREALEAAHLRGLRQHEALAALDAEQHARRLELAALGDEVAAKRETALRLIAEPPWAAPPASLLPCLLGW